MTISRSIEILERRERYLSKRILKNKGELRLLRFDAQERSALKRAVQFMREYLDYLENDGHVSSSRFLEKTIRKTSL